MSGTARDITYLFNQFKPVSAGGVPKTAQDMEDFIASVQTLLQLSGSASYDNDAAAAAGGVAVGQMYRNGNFVMVRVS
jgi:hypothetical protein